MTAAKRERVVEVKRGSRPDEILWSCVSDFDISERVNNCLRNANIKYVGELVQKTEEALLKLKNFGPRSLREVKKLLAGMELPGMQFQLGMQLDGWPGTPPFKGWPAPSLPPVIVNMNTGALVAQDEDCRPNRSRQGASMTRLTPLEISGMKVIVEDALRDVEKRYGQISNGSVCHRCGASYWDIGVPDPERAGQQVFGNHQPGCEGIRLVIRLKGLLERLASAE